MGGERGYIWNNFEYCQRRYTKIFFSLLNIFSFFECSDTGRLVNGLIILFNLCALAYVITYAIEFVVRLTEKMSRSADKADSLNGDDEAEP